jgi:hypothetical protein
VGEAAAHAGTEAHRGHVPPVPVEQVVGVVMPPVHVERGPQVPQSNVWPQLLMKVPHAHVAGQLVAFATHGGMLGVPHWNGVLKPQNSPVVQPPLTAPQSIWFAAAVPQPS